MSLDVRSKISILMDYVYLDNASSGPLPSPVVNSVSRFIRLWESKGEPWDEGLDSILNVRVLFSRLVNVSSDEVVCFPGVTYGLGYIISSLEVKRDSNIVVSSLNFPTSIIIARSMASRGLVREVRVATSTNGDIDLSVYEKLIDDNTSIVLVDHVGWLSGHVTDLREIARIAHSHGAIIVSDAFHSIGVLPVDAKSLDVDILITGSYKWLMSIHGAAVAYIRREILQSINPAFSGWLSVEDSVIQRKIRGEYEFSRPIDTSKLELSRDPTRLEPGTLPLISFVALEEALRFIIENDAPGKYSNHTWRLAEYLAEELENMGLQLYTPRENHSAIITFKHKNPESIVRELEKYKIRVAARPSLVRVSPHFYNNKDDIDKLIEKLAGIVRRL
ncbi:MAG: aminotransferase class V-fold PLP-dependent enzyme [Acidilobaceae archaeon]